MQAVADIRVPDHVRLPCHMVPYGLNLRFFGREAELDTLRAILNPAPDSSSLRAVGIHGLGGVGKSQLALHYANTSMHLYDVIAWIPSKTQHQIVHALSSLSSKLGLAWGGGDSADDYQTTQTLRDWLNMSNRSFLLIFDNVENAEILDQIWPASNKGSIIITTRSPIQASRRVLNTLALQSFSLDTAKMVLESLTCLKLSNEAEDAAAEKTCQFLGGLPLAIAQVSHFIRGRECSYAEFLQIYKKSAKHIFAKAEKPVEYDDSVLTTWNTSFERLSETAMKLLKLLVFFDPDLIQERLITHTEADIEDPTFEFVFDKFDFGEAVMELIQTSIITRVPRARHLSTHRLLQMVIFSQLPKTERVALFDLVVHILLCDFPDTWHHRDEQQGHGWRSWETWGAILPHVERLMHLSTRYKIKPGNAHRFAELVFRAGTYLWEREQPALAKVFFEFGVGLAKDISSTTAAQAHRYMGHVHVDLAQPQAALMAYNKALHLRKQQHGSDSPPVADVYDSVACAYAEGGDTEHAFEYLNRAKMIHNAHDQTKMTRTLAIRAMTHLRAGKPGEAQAAIQICWRLQNTTQAQIETSPYPKHSGDIMLQARIFSLQGKKTEAQKLILRAIEMRRAAYGESGGPRVADSLFHLAQIQADEGEVDSAAKTLKQVIDMSGDAARMKPHLARAYWFSANLEEKLGDEAQASKSRDMARATRAEIEGREWPDEDSDESFTRLVTWMLW
ncbi:P-loop containing nucleoside triphosphate hydrolase protein [Stachybotrys elegans]|uniref:P-loop containing nucleoside triphosphate hydrolase protein n=1 Tax=Stachybotrys elegans TaxID=80388 RepID=A0A8K0SW59_9HYPO|nr:P-loop containing nucleoside triphosphate hydrolase protein [Stachybotrys elegans]